MSLSLSNLTLSNNICRQAKFMLLGEEEKSLVVVNQEIVMLVLILI